MITQEQLQQRLHYNFITGDFIHVGVPSTRYSRFLGKVAGSLDPNGYRMLSIDNKTYPAHRMAFLYMNGTIPNMVDHINQNPSDNMWCNLIASNHSENGLNRHDNVPTPYVYKKGNGWQVCKGGKYYGYFLSYEEACQVSLTITS